MIATPIPRARVVVITTLIAVVIAIVTAIVIVVMIVIVCLCALFPQSRACALGVSQRSVCRGGDVVVLLP